MPRGPENFTNLQSLGQQQGQPIAAQSGPASIAALDIGFGIGVVGVQIGGTWVGTLVFEASQDLGQTWFGVSVLSAGASATAATSVTANGNYIFPSGGYTNFRVRCSAYTSGTANVLLVASVAQPALSYVASTVSAQNLTGASPNAASTVIGPTLLGLDPFRSVAIVGTLQGATGGTLDVYIQTTIDGGTTWVDAVHFAQLAAAAAAIAWECSLTRGDRSASGTPTSVNVASGTPSLAAGSSVPDLFGNGLRVVYVAGAGTSAGSTQTIKLMLATQ